jgi:hypothetical protein
MVSHPSRKSKDAARVGHPAELAGGATIGVVEDVGKVMEDFLAPELREITAKLEALDKEDRSAARRDDGCDSPGGRLHDGDPAVDTA